MYFKEINEYYLRMMMLKTGIFMNKYIFFDILVRSERLELSRETHTPLKRACLPISARPQQLCDNK